MSQAELMTKADRLVSATLMAWSTDPHQVPRLSKFLTAFYYVLVEQKLDITSIDVFLSFDRGSERERILDRTENEWVRQELGRLYAMGRAGYEAYLESTGNRLRMFAHPQVREALSGSLSIKETIDRGRMLLVNLQPSDRIGEEARRVIGTLLVNEICDITIKRQDVKEFYLVIDECHRFMTPDIGTILAETAKRGLHLMLFHQDRDQVKHLAGALQSAQTKIFFSTEERPLPARHFILRCADHTTYRDRVLTVKDFHVPRERREALIDSLCPRQEARQPSPRPRMSH